MAPKDQRLNWREGNKIDLLRNGGEFFPSLCAAIDQARRSVHLETYIFRLDRTGLKVLDHLSEACKRGIKVRVVIDGFGSADHARDIAGMLADMGARYRIYRPEPQGLRAMRVDPRRLRRLHRKTAVVDNEIAFVGGINILDDYEEVPDDGAGPRPRFDFAVRLEGPIVADVARAQRSLWLRMAWRRRDDWAAFYQRLRNWGEWRRARVARPMARFEPGRRAAFLLRDNVRYRQTIENVYLATLAGARHDILIANAYFFPGRRLRKALEEAAHRGVRVRLLLQGRSEYPLQYRACRYMYCKLIDDGIELYEYMASYLHAKVAVMDSCSMVGSSNLDPFSLLLAREGNVYVQDASFARELTEALELEMRQNSRRVREEDLQRRGRVGRWIDAFSYFMLRVGVAITGKSSEY
ncbi:cardiolipin synthase ClsB [Parapusillimonas granuli]|uniref:Cardiolipin synthase B n=1 Tax=Parapusillimonas granuli TaxID=380911 RepID=A0A853FT95_9BURK|nr:cardiolipin synthase ClsB [Parapusillimonas granuli]MBB5216231.1 cardiolipin synthase [Parapusillimonas granuli]MEB2400506.1 cardiolipin synthase ClsB [Alcaligenaceae bacterium]NYT47908.1 cardiolipin synthase ClsB [Parapusillimonas granuli]